MNIQKYLLSELENSANYVLTTDDKGLINKAGLEEFIYTKLTSKKYRKWAVDDLSEKQAKRAIHLNVSNNKPLQFRFPFGGYKLFRIPTSPEIDYAEFFSVAYYLKYLAPLASAYKPGLELLFSSDDMIIERMDNVPKKDTDSYFNSFKVLLEAFRKHLPENLKINIVRIGDLFQDKTAMEKELAENLTKTKELYKTADDEKRQKMATTSELNIRWDGAKDLTNLSQNEKQEIIAMGPVYHDAYCSLSKRREFNRGEDKIVIFTTLIPNAIAIGTTKASVTKFWTGLGALEIRGDKFVPRILSPKQIEQYELRDEPVDIGLDLNNLKIIKIINS